MIVIFCLFITSFIVALNFYKLVRIKNSLFSLKEIDNMSKEYMRENARKTSYLIQDIDDLPFITYCIVFVTSIISIIYEYMSFYNIDFRTSNDQLLVGTMLTIMYIVLPLFIMDMVIPYLRDKYMLFNKYFDFIGGHENIYNDEIYLVNSRRQIKFSLTIILSIMVIGILTWSSTIFYLIISLITKN